MRKLEELPNCMCFSLEHDDGVLYIAQIIIYLYSKKPK